jgi:hypothetical protein
LSGTCAETGFEQIAERVKGNAVRVFQCDLCLASTVALQRAGSFSSSWPYGRYPRKSWSVKIAIK